jgi:hypothetical protein
MKLPQILEDRPAAALDLLQSAALCVLGAMKGEALIESTELAYGFEDLPLLDELADLLRGAVRFWHEELGIATDFAVLQRGFLHAFRMGLETAGQIRRQDGDGLRIGTDLKGILDGRRVAEVSEPLDRVAQESAAKVENAFVIFQDQLLVPIASGRSLDMLYDAYACGCLWAALAGCDRGLSEVADA